MESGVLFDHDKHGHEQTLTVKLLEAQYHDSLKCEDLAHKDEDSRRLRVRLLFQEEENDDLHDRLAVEDDHVYVLEAARAELQDRLEQAETDTQQHQAELRAKAREIETLKTELISMNGLSKDSNRLLTEKLELSRELAGIKPELDHLRSQASFQQKILSEKLLLQRQLSTIEVELEAAKSAASKQQVAQISTSKKEADFQKQLDDLKKELAREQREREQIQLAAERDAREWESKRGILEGKVEAMRTKLRSTKEELKEVQASLAQTIAQASKSSAPPDGSEAQQKSRKRTGLTILDNTIGTPDGIAVRGKRGGQKRGKLDQTSLGEKSMFSITPYLNKTTNMQHETPKCDEEVATEADRVLPKEQPDNAGLGHPAAADILTDPSPSAPRVRLDVKPSKKPVARRAKASVKKSDAATKTFEDFTGLERVSEEPELEPVAAPIAEAKAAPPQPSTVITKSLLAIPTMARELPEPRKKKRKILGTSKTIFDEEDAEATRRPTKTIMAPNKVLGRLGGKKNLANAPAAQFAAFSPLKKDKRGVQASFLG